MAEEKAKAQEQGQAARMTVRVAPEVCERASEVLDGLGITMSGYVSMALVALAQKGAVPFDATWDKGFWKGGSSAPCGAERPRAVFFTGGADEDVADMVAGIFERELEKAMAKGPGALSRRFYLDEAGNLRPEPWAGGSSRLQKGAKGPDLTGVFFPQQDADPEWLKGSKAAIAWLELDSRHKDTGERGVPGPSGVPVDKDGGTWHSPIFDEAALEALDDLGLGALCARLGKRAPKLAAALEHNRRARTMPHTGALARESNDEQRGVIEEASGLDKDGFFEVYGLLQPVAPVLARFLNGMRERDGLPFVCDDLKAFVCDDLKEGLLDGYNVLGEGEVKGAPKESGCKRGGGNVD